jgi:hypothetical protein
LNALGQGAQSDLQHLSPSLSEMMGWGQLLLGYV